ncbi:MAG: lignostilbene-alpha,beta-dioxygenase [Chlamydiales bacterium]|jgi:carotenoid cleavage dioxygenase-like enzyme|nr:lignostilbene-alpha,beta-dioxygenase [Chlamydiales bacterium]
MKNKISVLLQSFLQSSTSLFAICKDKSKPLSIERRLQKWKRGYSLGFRSLLAEISEQSLEVKGEIPGWINGDLFRVGPACFEVGSDCIEHWFDGLAMLYKISLQPGKITYSNKFLRSEAYRNSLKYHEFVFSKFMGRQHLSLWEKIFGLRKIRVNDNANVNVAKYGDSFVALTESPTPHVIFNPDNLDTIGLFTFSDELTGQATSAHPIQDPCTMEIFNYLISYGTKTKYLIYKINPSSEKRELLAELPVSHPSYMHSLGLTEHYVILPELPLTSNPLDFKLHRARGYQRQFKWTPSIQTKFTLIDRDKKNYRSYYTKPFFMYHIANCFEQGQFVIIDAITYHDFNGITTDELAERPGSLEKSCLERFKINIETGEVEHHILLDLFVEFPRIADDRLTKDYRFVYMVANTGDKSDFLNSLVKYDIDLQSSQIWYEPETYPGEPIFVSNPMGVQEDDGVVMSVVLSPKHNKSFLLLLNATNFVELARVWLPHHNPFALHGNFFHKDHS